MTLYYLTQSLLRVNHGGNRQEVGSQTHKPEFPTTTTTITTTTTTTATTTTTTLS